MLNSSWWLFLLYLVVNVSGKLDGQHTDKHNRHHPVNGSGLEREQHKAYHDHDDLFGAKITLFSVKHREYLSAVKSLMAMDEKKQVKLLLELVSNIVKVMGDAKNIIEKANFNPNDTFPSDEQSSLRDAIGNIVENTAFYSNLALYFPTVLLDRYKKDTDWQLLFAWAYKFTITSRLYDDVAEKLLDLVGQHLEIIPRRDDFYNPYDRKAIKEELQRESLRKMEEALRKKQEQKKLDRKKKKAKKPSLTRTELNARRE
uniref:Coiled-coil domain-containing protein 134 n=1 Tax=Elaeophora elaphi TaxID=1147741 RepID=A0A0R3RFA9_9BILA